jgi:hypothetical protein
VTTNRLWAIGLGLLTAVALVLGFFFGVQPQLAAIAEAEASTATVKAENEQHRVELAALKKQYESLDELQAELAVVRAGVPATLDPGGLIGSIYDVAQATGVGVVGITLGEPALYTPPASATPPAAGTPAAETPATETPDAAAEAAPAEEAAPAPAAAATDPGAGIVPVDAADQAAVGSGGFVTVPVTVTIGADYGALLSFITAIQSSKGRLFAVTQANVAAGATEATVSGLVFVLVDR